MIYLSGLFGILMCRIMKERSATYRKLKLRKDRITVIIKMFEIWSKTLVSHPLVSSLNQMATQKWYNLCSENNCISFFLFPSPPTESGHAYCSDGRPGVWSVSQTESAAHTAERRRTGGLPQWEERQWIFRRRYTNTRNMLLLQDLTSHS